MLSPQNSQLDLFAFVKVLFLDNTMINGVNSTTTPIMRTGITDPGILFEQDKLFFEQMIYSTPGRMV